MGYMRADLDATIENLRDLGVLTCFHASVTPEGGWPEGDEPFYRAGQVFLHEDGDMDLDDAKLYSLTNEPPGEGRTASVLPGGDAGAASGGRAAAGALRGKLVKSAREGWSL